MEERKNNAAVEKRFKDKLKTDRARIQVYCIGQPGDVASAPASRDA